MRPGDLVAKIDWDGQLNTRLLGILLEVKIDKKLLKSPYVFLGSTVWPGMMGSPRNMIWEPCDGCR